MVGKIEIGMLVHEDHNLAKILKAFIALGTVKIAKVR